MVSGSVENNIDQLHDVLLEMMHAIDVICQKYNLSYILGHGSLLGAVRHQGFIPWDDDLDILMPREDYNKFKAIVNVELADGYFFECMDNTLEYPYNFGKVRKTGTYFNEPFTAKLNILHCVHIDVFPMDYVDLTRPIRTHIVRRWTGHFTSFRYVKLGIMKMKIKYIPSLFLSLKTINWAANKLMTYTKSSDTVQELCHYGRTKPEINISAFTDIVRVPFEKYEFNIPREYDPILRGSYGDYMTPPPRENQHPTHCVGEFRL